jgi:hypothetical protein
MVSIFILLKICHFFFSACSIYNTDLFVCILRFRYSEEKDYDYQAGGKSASCKSDPNCEIGHFTAVVWKGSTELGIAKATGKVLHEGMNWFCTWAVGRYAPQGNIQGQYTTNVQQPLV